MNVRKRGSLGEDAAVRFLEERGFSVTERNFRCRWGEVDIIAQDAEFIVFAEVKLRRDARFAEAREFVGPAKQERLRKSAQLWLQAHPAELQPRFDVIEVYGAGTEFEIIHIENAF